jgi:hypothetical protein
MRSHYRWFAIAATAFAPTFAAAQQQQHLDANPLARGGSHPSIFADGFGKAPLDTRSGIGRPQTRYGPVTPVPEPSEWLMMIAGLGVLGLIVRRGAHRS